MKSTYGNLSLKNISLAAVLALAGTTALGMAPANAATVSGLSTHLSQSNALSGEAAGVTKVARRHHRRARRHHRRHRRWSRRHHRRHYRHGYYYDPYYYDGYYRRRPFLGFGVYPGIGFSIF